MRIIAGSYHVFGSGAASASLVIDGQAICPTEDAGNNGFVGWMSADVPLTEILSANKIEWHQKAIPVSGRKFSGKGRHFVKMYLWCSRHYEDRLILRSRTRYIAAQQRQYAKIGGWERDSRGWWSLVSSDGQVLDGGYSPRPQRYGLPLPLVGRRP